MRYRCIHGIPQADDCIRCVREMEAYDQTEQRIAELTAEVDRANELILLLRNAILHGDGQAKANAYAALQRHDRTWMPRDRSSGCG